jgi:hypothetical protein
VLEVTAAAATEILHQKAQREPLIQAAAVEQDEILVLKYLVDQE